MANSGGGIAEKIQDGFLSCTICYQPYNHPKALPCLHTFCEGCLRDYYFSRYNGTGVFPCPVCRREITVPAPGVSGFPDNHFIVGLSDTVTNFTNYDSDKAPLHRETDTGHTATGDNSARLIARFAEFGSDAHQFKHISGIALSEFTDDVIISDCVLNKIGIFSIAGKFRSSFLCNCSIRDVKVSRAGTILVAVSKADSAILQEYSIDGRLLGNHGSFYKYADPSGLALTSSGQPIVSSLRENCVHVLTPQKKPSIKFGSKGSGPNHFTLPHHLATNSKDHIIVSDTGNHRIKIHRQDGTYLAWFGKEGSGHGELFYPMGVCCDHYDNIYVGDATNYRVQMFSSDGTYLSTPVSKTFEYGIDVKPINVLFVRKNILMVVLKGTHFCQVHSYNWDVERFKPKQKTRSSDGFLFGMCCKKGYGYDEL